MTERKHNHYFKDVSHLKEIDVYRVLKLFDVTDPCVQHAVKKLLCAGARGAKGHEKDLREAVDSINRALQMNAEDMFTLHTQEIPKAPAILDGKPVQKGDEVYWLHDGVFERVIFVCFDTVIGWASVDTLNNDRVVVESLTLHWETFPFEPEPILLHGKPVQPGDAVLYMSVGSDYWKYGTFDSCVDNNTMVKVKGMQGYVVLPTHLVRVPC